MLIFGSEVFFYLTSVEREVGCVINFTVVGVHIPTNFRAKYLIKVGTRSYWCRSSNRWQVFSPSCFEYLSLCNCFRTSQRNDEQLLGEMTTKIYRFMQKLRKYTILYFSDFIDGTLVMSFIKVFLSREHVLLTSRLISLIFHAYRRMYRAYIDVGVKNTTVSHHYYDML